MDRALNARFDAFDAAEHFATEKPVNPAWEGFKDRGNEALKRGEHLHAARLYKQAAQLALGPLDGGMVHAFITALESWPEDSPQRRLVETEDVLWHNIMHEIEIPETTRTMTDSSGQEHRAEQPNKAAAIAFSNRAQAFLLAGKHQKALKSAKRAVEASPAYLKGHHREMKALEALGQAEEAKEVRDEMANYQKLRASTMQEGLALVAVGWIDWMRAKMIYLPCRFKCAVQALADELPEGERPVEVRASLVPFQGGQALMLSLVEGPMQQRRIDALDFYMVDTENGEIADAPPNGHASELALARTPYLIGKIIEELELFGLTTKSVMCGQGLTEHVRLINEKLKEGSIAERGEEHGIRPMPGLVVFRATSTGASEDSGVPCPAFDFSPDALRAAAARMGLPDANDWL